MPGTLPVLRYAVVALVALAIVVGGLSWLVRQQIVSPFGVLGRFCRAVSDPFIKPVERRLVRSGGNPVNAGWWLVLVTAVVGLVVLALSRWVMGLARDVNFAAHGGARGVYVLIVVWGYYLLVGALIVRIVGSWFGMFQYNRWIRPAYLLTDWLVRPIRKILPPFSGWDWSPLAAWLLLWVLKRVLLSLAAGT